MNAAAMMLLARQYQLAVGRNALEIATAKADRGFVQAIVPGMFGNALGGGVPVGLVYWFCYIGRGYV